MAINSSVFNSILSYRDCFCSLCYKIIEDDAIKIYDEVLVNQNSVTIHLSVMLATVFTREFIGNLEEFGSVCRQCTQSTIHSYTFIKMCKEKQLNISKSLGSLITSFENTKDYIDNCNSLYVTLNNENFTSTHYYDDQRPVITRAAAFKRYQSISNSENSGHTLRYTEDIDGIDNNFNSSDSEKPRKRSRKAKIIPTCDMLYDKKDPCNAKCKICLNTYSSLVKLRVHYIRTHAPKVLKCPDCHRSFASPTFLQQHKLYTHIPVACNVCGKNYSNRHSLKVHMLNHKEKDAVCQYCGKIYKNRKMVKRHIELSRCEKMEKNHICNLCGKKFANKEALLFHSNTHNDRNSTKGVMQLKQSKKIPTYEMIHDTNDPTCVKCKGCLRIFTSSKNLRDHYIRAHAPKVYKCPECPRTFGSTAHVKEHQQNAHCAGICNICGKQYSNRNSLKGHLATHKEKIVCPSCGRGYKNIKALNRHIEQNVCGQTRSKQIHKEFICDYCSKGFTQRCSLVSHIKLEHENGTAHVCMWCNKRYNCQSRLRVHIVTHTQEKNFTCEICGGKFVTKESLLYHTRIHTGERPYPCQHCDNRFLSASRLTEHIRRRHMSPTLECDICHSKFKVRSSLQKHRMRHFKPTSKLFTAPKLAKKETNYVIT